MSSFKQKFIFSLLCLQISFSYANINTYFDSIKNDPNALYAFFKTMPKGGELHYHLAGGAYPEAMIKVALTKNYCLNKEDLSVNHAHPCQELSKTSLITYPNLYEKILRAWSLKDFIVKDETAYDHFFNSFGKYMPIVDENSPVLLMDTMQRAHNQHELYLEIMLLLDKAKSAEFGSEIPTPSNFMRLKNRLLENHDFVTNIEFTVNEAERIIKENRTLLGCDKTPNQGICELKIGFQYYVLREQPLAQLFAQALNAFAAAAKSPHIVGVNLVQPEDGMISLRDYKKQMEIFGFLHSIYPEVHISLHAGELVEGRAYPDDLRFHIHDAVHIGKAERIGHGVDIAFENNADGLLKDMAANKIAVEVNLISNKKILGLKGKKHPLNYYLKHKVPVVLSTDDEGILRTDLTSQYVEAAIVHKLSYDKLKEINRNALRYSFLPGKGLWDDAEKVIYIKECKDLDAQSCFDFIKVNEKARLQWELEKKLQEFELNFAKE